MKVFLDANIIVAALTREASIYKFVIRILSASGQKFQFYTSGVCLAIGFYYATKKYGRQKVKQDIGILAEYINICNCGVDEISKSLANKQVEDFEDGLEYYSALNTGCNCIISQDLNDFYFSEIEVLNSREFLKKYLAGL